MVNSPKLNFFDARAACARLRDGSELAAITTAEDNDFIGSLASEPRADRFFGLRRKGAEKFKWEKEGLGRLRMDDYAGWFPGMPGRERKLRCVAQETRMINGVTTAGWVITGCNQHRRYVCQRPVPPTENSNRRRRRRRRRN